MTILQQFNTCFNSKKTVNGTSVSNFIHMYKLIHNVVGMLVFYSKSKTENVSLSIIIVKRLHNQYNVNRHHWNTLQIRSFNSTARKHW